VSWPRFEPEIPKFIALPLRRGADKSLTFPICSTTKRIFLGKDKEVRTTKSYKRVELRGEYVNTFFQSRSSLFSL
jgi:hypothetical protein